MAGRTQRKALSQEALIAILRAKAQRWIDIPNVTSIGVGYKETGGAVTGQLCIQVTVSRKLKGTALAAARTLPLPAYVEAGGQRIPVDVLERNYAQSYLLLPAAQSARAQAAALDPRIARRSRLERVMPGVSIGHSTGLAGTLGAIVYDDSTGVPCVLSNAHVLAANPSGDGVIVQPGRSDSAAVQANGLGQLLRSHIGLAGDCAVATISHRLFDTTQFELGVTPRRLAQAQVGDKVIKSGRTTGVTAGIVERIGVVFKHDYGPGIGEQKIGGFEIGPDPQAPAPNDTICDRGDSGSVWLIRENNAPTDIAVGLHFAQQIDPLVNAPRALACNIHSVLNAAKVSLVPRQ